MELIKTTQTRYKDNFNYYANDNIIGKSLEVYGEYAQQELLLMLWLCNADYVVYDIGANIGVHTVAVATTGAKIFAFEPQHQNFQLLKLNAKGLENVVAFQLAVGDKNTTTTVHKIDLSKPGNFGAVTITSDGLQQVSVVSLDTFDIPDPNFIKIDVEGSELLVLKGCEQKIKRSLPCIMYEAHETKNFAEIYQFLQSCGYSKFYWMYSPNFNQQNFKNHAQDIFENTACFSVIAWPPGWPEVLQMPEVTGSNDSCQRFVVSNQR